jgi:hypothetical protein
MALSAAAAMQSEGAIPDRIYIRRPQGGSTRMTPDDALVFFSRLLADWRESGALPQRVALPGRAYHSRRSPAVASYKASDEPGAPFVKTESLARQCRATVELVGRLRDVPRAVWVDGERISSAQFFGTVLACLAAGAQDKRLPEKVAVPSWRGPDKWPVLEPLPSAEAPVRDWSLPARGGRPAIALQPDSKQPVAGMVTLTVSYPVRGATIEVLLDGARKWMSNRSPFSFTWDTRTVPNGPHTMTMRAGLQDGSAQATLERTFTVANPPPAN